MNLKILTIRQQEIYRENREYAGNFALFSYSRANGAT